ncbi:WD40-repeat-containing domain protein [Cantharellus anzutake]|uniref:WD40-repeat-containing domain protein n=1 Tax=Cantharellus anzutake TaxID=1750568 RepID=UPI001903E76A|nr:WD40-repeat-containing domain protein [Cantharellus anzutake]KAF8329086.1 WD40-repeat-containing domain protein [Cantharellus anzutake]
MAAAVSTRSSRNNNTSTPSLSLAALGRAPGRLSLGGRRITSRDLQIHEATNELLNIEIPEEDNNSSTDVSLLRGFKATNPGANDGRARRRKMRNVDEPLAPEQVATDVSPRPRQPSETRKRRPRISLATDVRLGRAELERQIHEISIDQENIKVRRALLVAEVADISEKINSLENLRKGIDLQLLKLQEDDLELSEELEGVEDRLAFEESSLPGKDLHMPATQYSVRPIRRKRGPAFFPSEHDELPRGAAFMTLSGHKGPISALDFSAPYGLLVSASLGVPDEPEWARVWDLTTGKQIGRLCGEEGNNDAIKCAQVEENICATGGTDCSVNLWDLKRVGDPVSTDIVTLTRNDPGAGVSVLRGHSGPVTALYFDDLYLVSGASDKTIRQWDLSTGQCIQTMDLLWAISHPPAMLSRGSRQGLLDVSSPAFAVPTQPLSDGSWDMYQDFIGGLQFWGYALVSGSGDGAVRMWDMRTGQPHRTLMGHTEPVTSVQFDEFHIISGSLDKTIRIWDIRNSVMTDTIRFDYPVSALQFDPRRIIACCGENGVKTYNRTTLHLSSLEANGHSRPCERVRYMDTYMVSGGRDSVLKVWAL